MKVHLIKRQTVTDFVASHARSRAGFSIWLTALKYADWNTPADIQGTFGQADLLGDGSNRVVFDIGGNNYRLVASYSFGLRQVHLFICWIVTHAEYTKLCAKNQQYTANLY